MFELTHSTPEPSGPERGPGASRGAPDAAMTRWLTLTLDHVGRGMLLVARDGRVLHGNRQARQALQGAGAAPHPLCIDGRGQLRARDSHDDSQLAEALQAACSRGLRRMLTLGVAAPAATRQHARAEAQTEPTTIAVLPIDGGDSGAALVSLPQACRSQDLAAQCYARHLGFTPAESAVLDALLAGRAPPEIARSKGVALSTVRTQIGQMRLKSGSHSIRELMERVAALPPMMGLMQ